MTKPLGGRAYGSIAHLPDSRMGPGDHKITDGQAYIATVKARKSDVVIVQEKLDGSNCCVAKINGEIVALTRAGYRAHTSSFQQHHIFDKWVAYQHKRFNSLLAEGERVCGEWLHTAHGTLYNLPHEPFVVFDILTDKKRLPFAAFMERVKDNFITPYLVSAGPAVSIATAMEALGERGKHGAVEQIEGAVWRVETDGEVNFLCKYVRPDKLDGKYLKIGTFFNTYPLTQAKEQA